MLLIFDDGSTFGIEVDLGEALEIVDGWFRSYTEPVFIQGYDINPSQIKKIEFLNKTFIS